MSSLKFSRAGALEAPHPTLEAARRLAASGLRSASAALARCSRRLTRPARPEPQPMPQLEFYADAGAPEGALYLDGRFIGRIEGVTRL